MSTGTVSSGLEARVYAYPLTRSRRCVQCRIHRRTGPSTTCRGISQIPGPIRQRSCGTSCGEASRQGATCTCHASASCVGHPSMGLDGQRPQRRLAAGHLGNRLGRRVGRCPACRRVGRPVLGLLLRGSLAPPRVVPSCRRGAACLDSCS